MRDEPVNSGAESTGPRQTLDQGHDLDQRIVHALETVPEVHVPADFAARIAAQLPARRPVALTPTHYGKTAMVIALVITFGGLLILAAQTGGHAGFGLVESVLFAQFLALAVCLTVWRRSLR